MLKRCPATCCSPDMRVQGGPTLVLLVGNASLAAFPGALPVYEHFLVSGPVSFGNPVLDLGNRTGLLQVTQGAQLLLWRLVCGNCRGSCCAS